MNPVTLTVHRSAHEIGGNCIEVASGGARVLLDVGRPLEAPRDATGLLPATLDVGAPVDGVLISHPHLDHYGLLGETPASWPVHCGAATAELIKLTSGLSRVPVDRPFCCWTSGVPHAIGPFRVTPFLTDHSAFDAHMLLIQVAGRRIFYSGDFRRHGRKSALVERLMAAPPDGIDVLLMEGTNLGSDKPTASERDLEHDFVALMRETAGRVFVAWSAQNIDRTVTLYRACLQAGRTLVVDLYTADVLERLGAFAQLPQPGWNGLKVVITRRFASLYRARGQEAFVARMARHGLAARDLEASPHRWVIMTRSSLIRDYAAAGVAPTPHDAWSWSMWNGYLRQADGRSIQAWFEAGDARAAPIHTSGHASPQDLRAFAASLAPACMVPIHSFGWDGEREGFPPIRRLRDGEPMIIGS